MSDGTTDATPELELEALLADDHVYSALEDLVADQRRRVAYYEGTSRLATQRVRQQEHLLTVAQRGLDMLLNIQAKASDLLIAAVTSPTSIQRSSDELPGTAGTEVAGVPETAAAPCDPSDEAELGGVTVGHRSTTNVFVRGFEPDRADDALSGATATLPTPPPELPAAPDHVLDAGTSSITPPLAARPGNAAGTRVAARTDDAGWRGEGGRSGDTPGPGAAAILPALTADVPLRYRVAAVLAAAGEPLTVRAVLDELAARDLAPSGRGEHAKRSVRRAMSDASDLEFRRGPENAWMLLTPVRPARDLESTVLRDAPATGGAKPGGAAIARIAADRRAV